LFWDDELRSPADFGRNPLWVANYGVKAPKLPSTWKSYAFRQYSDSGHVDGVPGGCDLDSLAGSTSDLDALKMA